MKYKLLNYNKIINKITNKDKLFIGDYIIDPYQNCEFGCKYCDSSFDKNIYAKINSSEILEKELKNKDKGTIIIGSVHDPYQNAEKKFNLTRRILEVIKSYDFPCHILTKSNLILRDINLISKMKCNITISMISSDIKISKNFENNISSPKKRFGIVKKLNENGIPAGIALIPILPYIIDNELEKIVKYSYKSDAKYFLYKHLELKGYQKELFFNLIKENFPDLQNKYKELFKNQISPDIKYVKNINKKINSFCKKYKIKNKLY